MAICKQCGGERTVKNGTVRGKARYKCKDCGLNFTDGDGRVRNELAAKKALAVILYSLGKASFGMLAKIFGVSRSLTYGWIREKTDALPEPVVAGTISEMEFDEMWHKSGQKNKKWIIKAVDRSTGRTVTWVIGGRDAATFRRLYDKVKHLTHCTFYTDDWDAFAAVLPAERHVIGKAHTVAIERDNSNTRHHLGRMTRRTKVVSKKESMVHASNEAMACVDGRKNLSAVSKRLFIYL